MSQNSPKQWFKLEELFFSQVDQQLIENLRNDIKATQTADAIMRVTGISSEALAEEIASVGVTVDTLAAFRLAPMVAVAWADDRVESDERDVILAAATQSGIAEDDPAMGLLKSWTKRRPNSDLLDAWCDYAVSLSGTLDAAQKTTLRDEIVSQANKVAEACGGILGFGSISPNEKATLERVRNAFA